LTPSVLAVLRRCHYEATGSALDAGAVRSTLDLLEARALFDAPERAVFVRIAEQGGRIYLDLADEHWRAVEIGPDGWQVIGSPPVRFRPQFHAGQLSSMWLMIPTAESSFAEGWDQVGGWA
jgi:hypothetical protein